MYQVESMTIGFATIAGFSQPTEFTRLTSLTITDFCGDYNVDSYTSMIQFVFQIPLLRKVPIIICIFDVIYSLSLIV